MGFLDALLGRQARPRRRPPDRLFAMSTAYVTLETQHGIKHARRGRRSSSSRWRPPTSTQIVTEMEEVLRAPARRPARRSRRRDDELRLPLDDPARRRRRGPRRRHQRGQRRARGRRLRRPRARRRVRVRGRARAAACTSSTTTSAAPGTRSCRPRGEQQRDDERELQLKAQIGGELPIEPELERWFPLWGVPI